jgi:hypothetical protein
MHIELLARSNEEEILYNILTWVAVSYTISVVRRYMDK